MPIQVYAIFQFLHIAYRLKVVGMHLTLKKNINFFGGKRIHRITFFFSLT